MQIRLTDSLPKESGRGYYIKELGEMRSAHKMMISNIANASTHQMKAQ